MRTRLATTASASRLPAREGFGRCIPIVEADLVRRWEVSDLVRSPLGYHVTSAASASRLPAREGFGRWLSILVG